MSSTLTELQPDRILIIRLGAVRDGLMTLPLAVDIKRLWPEAHLSWISDGEVDSLLQSHPNIDQVIRIEPQWIRHPKLWQPVRQQVRSQQFDLVFDPQSVFKSAVLGMMTGCKVRVGFDRPYAREMSSLLLTHKIRPTLRHRVDVYRQLLTPWSHVEPGQGRFELPSAVRADQQPLDVVIRDLVGDQQSWFVIYPGAIWPTAVWPIDRYAQVAKYMSQHHNMLGVVVWREPHEQLVAQVIAEQSGDAAVVAPELRLDQLVDLCRLTPLLLSPDSDLLQIASATSTPAIGLHGPTWADEIGPYGFVKYAIQSPFPLNSRRRMRKGNNSPMQAIEVEEVIYDIQRLLRQLSKSEVKAAAA